MKDLVVMVVYLNSDGSSVQQVQENSDDIMNNLHKSYSDYPNIKFIILPVRNQDTRIECVYPINHFTKTKHENIMLTIYELILNGKDEKVIQVMKNFERKIKLLKLRKIL